MHIGQNNRVIFLKDVQSNIIEEAVVVLKENVNLFDNINIKNKKINYEQINFLKEAELIINEELNKSNYEFEKFKINKLENKLRWLKIINILIIVCSLIFILVNH